MSFKENDIRPVDLMKLKEPALEHDKEFLRTRHDQFINVDCPACQSKEYAHWAEKEGFTYDQCSTCATIFMNPRAPEALLGEFYKQSQNYDFWNKYIFPASDNVRKEKIFKPRANKVLEICKKYDVASGTLLEIGAAFGTFCEAIRDHGYFSRVIAVEPTPGLAATCRSKGIETMESTVEELEIPENSVDVVANFEVLEHLGNPSLFISQSVKYLKIGGIFICTCPNGEGIGTLVLKEHAKVVDHEHVNYFNPHSLALLLQRHHMEVLEVSTPGELDVELLGSAIMENPKLVAGNSFFELIFSSKMESAKGSFQKFLKENLLSSHMWIVAKKV